MSATIYPWSQNDPRTEYKLERRSMRPKDLMSPSELTTLLKSMELKSLGKTTTCDLRTQNKLHPYRNRHYAIWFSTTATGQRDDLSFQVIHLPTHGPGRVPKTDSPRCSISCLGPFTSWTMVCRKSWCCFRLSSKEQQTRTDPNERKKCKGTPLMDSAAKNPDHSYKPWT